MTWNVHGEKRATHPIARVTELHTLIRKCRPIVLFLQETWTQRGDSRGKPGALQAYSIFRTSTPKQANTRGRPKAGLLVAIAEELRPSQTAKVQSTSLQTQGYLLPVLIDTGTQKTLLLNVYAPPVVHGAQSAGAIENAKDVRAAVFEEALRVVRDCRREHPGVTVLAGGDLNAAPLESDRDTPLQKQDHDYLEWLAAAEMVLCEEGGRRQRSFVPFFSRNRGTEEGSSRIDDWLTDAPGIEGREEHGPKVVSMAHGSDHDPLWLHLLPEGYTPPGPEPSPVRIRRIVTPFTPERREQLSLHLENRVDTELVALAGSVEALRSEGVEVGHTAALEAVSTDLDALLAKALAVTMDTVGEPEPAPGGHPGERPQQRGHLGNAEKREYKALCHRQQKARAASRQLHGTTQERVDGGEHPAAVTEYYVAYPAVRDRLESPESLNIQDMLVALEGERKIAAARAKTLLKTYDRRQRFQWELRMNNELRYNAKKVHRRLFGGATTGKALTAVRTEGGGVDTSKDAVLAAAKAHFYEMGRPVPGQTEDVPPPWSRDVWHGTPLDKFELPRVGDRAPLNFRVGSLYNRHVYDQTLASMPGRKAPGIDGVPNEVLKHLPVKFHELLHQVFVVLWGRRCTPHSWKHALTILLYEG